MNRSVKILLTGVVVAAFATGCTSTTAPAATETEALNSSGAVETPAPTSTQGSDAADPPQKGFPSCSDLLWPGTVEAIIGVEPKAATQRDKPFADAVGGPEAQAAAAQALQSTACSYSLPNSDTGFSIGVAELEPAASDELEDALQAASDTYTAEEAYYGTIYTGEIPGGLSTIKMAYIFDGDRWIVASGGSVTIDAMKLAAIDAHADRYTPAQEGM